MTIDLLLVFLLGVVAAERQIPEGLPAPYGWAAKGVAFGGIAAYALAAALDEARPRAARLGAASALGVVAAAAVVVPAGGQVLVRLGAGRHQMIHDGALQTEIAAEMLLDGRNPYAEDFRGTPLERWLDWPENAAMRRYTYLPLTFMVHAAGTAAARAAGLPWDARVVSVGGLLASAALLAPLAPAGAPRRAVVAAALLNPFAFAGGGDGDVVGLALLAAGLVAGAPPAGAARPGLAGLALGAACAWKESAWPIAPLLALPAWAGADAAGRRRLLVSFAVLPAATILPFLLLDGRAFWGDVVLYKSGGVPDAYAIGSRGGLGVAALLEPLGVAVYHGRFPFVLLQAAIGLPLLAVLGRRVLRDPTPARAAGAAVLLFLPFAFLGRYLHENHLAPVLPLLVLASLSFAGRE